MRRLAVMSSVLRYDTYSDSHIRMHAVRRGYITLSLREIGDRGVEFCTKQMRCVRSGLNEAFERR